MSIGKPKKLIAIRSKKKATPSTVTHYLVINEWLNKKKIIYGYVTVKKWDEAFLN